MTTANQSLEIIPIENILQGALLPYEVLDNQHTNAAYPKQKLEIRNGGYGSDAAAHPTHPNQFYALTDRGPNADYKGSLGDGKQFLLPDYTPRIGLFEIQPHGEIKKVKEILLKDANGTPITGLPNPKALGGTNEIPYDVSGEPMIVNPELPFDEVSNPLRTDINGLDPEGLAALEDGTFWISDEYGPHLVHYDADGVEVHRINPFTNDSRNNVMVNDTPLLLPLELSKRRANRGMEALTITPDQTTLVGIIESSMDNPDKSGRLSTLLRMVTINLITGAISQYLYQLDKPHHVTSGLIALSNHKFYLIEHDRKFPLQKPEAQKLIYKINIANATDIETLTDSKTLKQDDALGLLVDGQTLEQFINTHEDGWEQLADLGIRPIHKSLAVNVLKAIDYPHDKLEGIWLRQDGSIGLLNDDDFGMTDDDGQLEQKYLDANKTMEDANRLYVVKPSTD
ncbi:MAG: esterase-like activity of phytase family protein [Psychrobacter sp.]|nr:esterase-like activity of phytase family protein [Psychrobacter sp.]